MLAVRLTLMNGNRLQLSVMALGESEFGEFTMSNQSPVTALVEFEVRTSGTSVADWLAVWQDRSEDALDGEPETSAYEAAVSEDNPNQVLIFERYTGGQASIDAHVNRPAHVALTATMGERQMTRRRVMSNLFSDIDDYGWWDRNDGRGPMRDSDVILSVLGTRFPDPASQQEYIELTRRHADYCRSEEPDTLIYNGCIAQRDADRGPDIKAGDLIFVAGFRNKAALLKHRDDPRHLELQPLLNDIRRERKFTGTYRTTGKGFLWK